MCKKKKIIVNANILFIFCRKEAIFSSRTLSPDHFGFNIWNRDLSESVRDPKQSETQSPQSRS